MTGALPAVQERLPRPLNDADVIVGTSAGSVVAAALRCRSSIDEMIAFQRGQAAGVFQNTEITAVEHGPLPPWPQLRVGSAPLVLAGLLKPHRVHPTVRASAWLPRGRGHHHGLRAMVHTLHMHAHQQAAFNGSPPHWVDRPTWIVAVDYDSGQRVVFGREGAPHAPLPDAVAASCSIPGWYQPVTINGRHYVDGGVRSTTSLRLLATAGVDEVYVLAPMASIQPGRTRKPHERLERRLRWLMTHALLRDAHALRSRGIKVTVLTPGPEDLAVMGVNLMDPRRRLAVLETSLRTSAAALAGSQEPSYQVA
jgi:NTE family protein